MRVLFLLGMASHARYWKRIKALEGLGVIPVALAFNRRHYDGATLPSYCTVIGTISHGNYLRRLPSVLRAVRRVRNHARNCKVIYAFDLDMALLGWIASLGFRHRPQLVYEVGDIRQVKLNRTLFGAFVRFCERFLLRRISRLVVTSEDYISGYYTEILRAPLPSYEVIENKLSPDTFPSIQPHFPSDINFPLQIGYIGVLRCHRSWVILRRLMNESEELFNLHLHGVPFVDRHLVDTTLNLPAVHFHGPYVSPDDLVHIYRDLDIIWASYPYQGRDIGNWCWARTTRFYESCYFNKPMIVHKGTADARYVKSLDIGVVVDLSDIEGTIARLQTLNASDIQRWRNNLHQLPRTICLYTNEHRRLFDSFH